MKVIPARLKVSEDVTEEEYRVAKREASIVLWVALLSGILVATVLIFLIGGAGGLVGGGFFAILMDRLMNHFLKNAHKMKTLRMKNYPELRNLKRGGGSE